jgi:hypothetical protein
MAAQAQISIEAIQAAIWVARQFGINCSNPVILHHSQHVSIRLFPSDVVARILKAEPQGEQSLRRELAVAWHLVQKAAPVVGPTTKFPAGPHFRGGLVLTLWQFVEHFAADFENREHVAGAAIALRDVHNALADFPGELPSFQDNNRRVSRIAGRRIGAACAFYRRSSFAPCGIQSEHCRPGYFAAQSRSDPWGCGRS